MMNFTLVNKESVPSTVITFHEGGIKGKSKVLNAAAMGDKKIAIFLESTPFHPVDSHWPDQPGDKGTLKLGGAKTFIVIECNYLAINKETYHVAISKSVPKAEKEKWSYVVGHIIESEEEPETWINAEAETEVDEAFRKQLCLHHTSSHLVAFALNMATKGYWKKDKTGKDSLGSPDFDKEAIESAVIFFDHCEDTYRFGSKIKKQLGLKTEELFKGIGDIEKKVNEILKGWLSVSREVTIWAAGNTPDATRKWRCQLPEGLAEMPCGGTHLSNVKFIASITYTLEVKEDNKEKKLFGKVTAKASGDY